MTGHPIVTLMLLAALRKFLWIIKIWFKGNMGKYAGTLWHLHLFTDYAGFFVMILPPTAGHTSFLYLGYFKSFFTKNPTATIYSFLSSFLHILICTFCVMHICYALFFLHLYEFWPFRPCVKSHDQINIQVNKDSAHVTNDLNNL